MSSICDEQSAAIGCPETLKLAKLHWLILKSSSLMDDLCTETVPDPRASVLGFRQYRSTRFADEVGRDEIEWWINQKERDLAAFSERSSIALEAAQVLKDSIAKLKGIDPSSYEGLLSTLRAFVEAHTSEIDTLYNYVQWLYSRDKRAPSLLFTYKVWGTTRRSDRTVSLSNSETPEDEDPEVLRALQEIVMGVSNDTRRTIDSVRLQLSYELFESMSDDEECDGVEVTVPPEWLLQRTTWNIVEECVTYFTFIRDSLRDIENEIGKREARENVINSDFFWRSFVVKAIKSRKVETQLWDFKETLTMWRAQKGDARRDARVTFAEEIASFANADGGCLIVGISNGREVIGISETDCEKESRIKSAHDALAGHLAYPRKIFHLKQVLISDKLGVDKLCLIVAVARACEVVAVKDCEGRYTYPIRHGTGSSNGDLEKLRQARRHEKNDSFDFLTELKQFVRDN